jgi:hypothetical protein
VEANADSNSELRDGGIHERAGANCLGGAVEEREKAVAGGHDLPASEAIDRRSEPHVVLLEHGGPCVIAEALQQRGRAHDVAEQHGRQQRIGNISASPR